jgi:HSP20 family molecular chaperone IbpA
MRDQSSSGSSIVVSTDVNLVSVDELFEHTQDVFNVIARRAYEIFERRRSVHGDDQGDWFLAEAELLRPETFHLSESGGHLTVRAKLPGFHRKEIKVSLGPKRLSISGKTEPLENRESEKHPHSHRHAQLMYHVIDLPCAVDPSVAKATYSDCRLEVVMPKATFTKSAPIQSLPELPAE